MNWTAIIIAGAIMGGLAIIFAIILGIADKKFAVEIDSRVPAITECLGGANCGACGYAGCSALAEAIVRGDAAPNSCPASKGDKLKRISELLGVEAEEKAPMMAQLLCAGDCEAAAVRYEYTGAKSCRIANGLAGGPKMCTFACLGMGDCVRDCKFGAITIGKNGLPQFDRSKCTGCGACAKQCPRGAIQLVPRTAKVAILCRNDDMGKEAKDNCKNACIGCQRCAKTCPQGAISLVGKHCVVDQEKCVGCMECTKVCPMGCIVTLQ
ncbi:MAG: RnfABCDGE type electron transport complex subunit B [Clostridia bacterium]|nr:RnfABCDGE type electron transport complex subunit B [Clostridia bacterium]